MKEAPSSSETSVLTRATRRNIPKDTILHSHRRENLKSYLKIVLTVLKYRNCLTYNTKEPCYTFVVKVWSCSEGHSLGSVADSLITEHDIRGRPLTRGGDVYMDLQAYKIKMSTNRLHLNFKNLFNGDKALGKSPAEPTSRKCSFAPHLESIPPPPPKYFIIQHFDRTLTNVSSHPYLTVTKN
jgi:hypothetical protein